MQNVKDLPPVFPIRKALVFSCLSASAIILLAVLLFIQMRAREVANLEELIRQNTILISDAVQSHFTLEIQAIKRMADRWELSGGTPREVWYGDAKNYIQDIPGLETVSWLSPKGDMLWQQSKEISTDLPDFYASAAVRRHWMSLSPARGKLFIFIPSPEISPSLRLMVLIPVYKENQFTGFILGGFDSKKLLESSVSLLAKKYYEIRLHVLPDTQPSSFVRPLTAIHDIHIQDVTLQVEVSPTKALFKALYSVLPFLTLVIGAWLAVIAGIIVYFIQRTIWQSRKLSQQSQWLHESESSFQMLIDGVGDYAIYMLDPKGCVKSWNSGAERIKQYKTDEILGRHFSLFYTPEDRAVGEPAKALYIAAATGKYITEGWRVRKGGDRYWASVVINALKDTKGELIGYANITRDITPIKTVQKEREELMKKLLDSNAELERFAFIATHDLQEPLRLICNYSALLKTQYAHELGLDARQYTEIIESASKRMYALIHDLLEYARISDEQAQNNPIDVSQCLKYVTDILHMVIQETGAEITSDPLPVLKGSPVYFSTLLQNLIGNALKYKHKDAHPVIHIGAEDTGKEWRLSVRDNGIGIKPEYLQQIFEPFKRLHNKDEYGGTGMGLAICRKIISRMGGRIWAESSAGTGSIFYFTIPHAENTPFSSSHAG